MEGLHLFKHRLFSISYGVPECKGIAGKIKKISALFQKKTPQELENNQSYNET